MRLKFGMNYVRQMKPLARTRFLPTILFALLTIFAHLRGNGADPAGAASKQAVSTASTQTPPAVQPMTADESYKGIAKARTLIGLKKWDEAKNLFDELEQRVTQPFARGQVFRTQAHAAEARKDYEAAEVAYRKMFDLILKPQYTPEELHSTAGAVLRTFQNEYVALRRMAKQGGPTAEFRGALMHAVQVIGDSPTLPDPDFQAGLAIAQLELARAFIKEGKRQEGLDAYEVLFTNYSDFQKADGTAINTRYAWIEAHGYGRSSAERITLLQKVYADPAFKDNPRVANIGVHLGHAYMMARHPHEEFHWKALVEQIEGFQKQPTKDKFIAEMLRDNYEGALMNYASALDRRGETEMLRGVVLKLEKNFGDSEGGKTARRLKAKLDPIAK